MRIRTRKGTENVRAGLVEPGKEEKGRGKNDRFFPSPLAVRPLKVRSPLSLLSDSLSSRFERSVELVVQKLPHGGWPVPDE